MSEEIEFHGWLGKKKVPSSTPRCFFSGIALTGNRLLEPAKGRGKFLQKYEFELTISQFNNQIRHILYCKDYIDWPRERSKPMKIGLFTKLYNKNSCYTIVFVKHCATITPYTCP